MKVVILAGGFGTRLSEYTDTIPKPMVPIGNIPIIEHIMRTYAFYGYKDFIIALGYKGERIKKYFENFKEEWKINNLNEIQARMSGWQLETFKESYGHKINNGISLFKKKLLEKK